MAGETTSLRYSVELPAGTEVVWSHLIRPDLLIRWWPDEAVTEPVPGGEYAMSWKQGLTLRGTYLDVEPATRLVWAWSWDHEDDPPRRVEMALTERDGITRLDIDHEAATEEERASYEEGWAHFLGRLARLLAE